MRVVPDWLERLPLCRVLHRERSHTRRDDPLIVGMELHVRPDTDPAKFKTTAARNSIRQGRLLCER